MLSYRRLTIPLLFGVTTTAVTACHSGAFLRAGGPFPDESAPNEGIRYYAGKDLLVVEVRKVTTAERSFVLENGTCVININSASDTLFAVSAQTVADRKQAFRLGLRPKGSVKQAMTIAVSDAGLLTGVNYVAEDKTAELASNILRAVSSVAGTIGGIGALAAPAKAASNDECYAITPSGQKLTAEIAELERTLSKLSSDRLALAREVPGARNAADVSLLRAKDSLLMRTEAHQAAQLAQAREARAMGTVAYARAKRIGTKVDTLPAKRYSFDISVLQDGAPLSTALVGTQKELLDSAGLVVEVEDAPAGTSNPVTEVSDSMTSSISCDKPTADTCARIQYRMPRWRLVRVYNAKLHPLESTLMLLASSADPVLNIGFDSKRIGSGSVKLTFGKYGNVTSIEQVSEAKASTASAAFVKALADSRSDFLEGIKSVGGSQKALVGIEEAGRAARIKELQDQKSLLDAELAAHGARANRELLLQKQQIDTEISLLTSQQNLATKSAAPNPVQSEIDALKVQVELLKAQIETEKLKRDLEAARRPPVLPQER